MTATKARAYRILQVHPFLKGDGINPAAGGKSRLSLQLSRELALRGQEVAVFPYPEPLLEKGYPVQNAGSPFRLLPTTVFPSFPSTGWYSLKAMQLPVAEKSLRNARMDSMFLAGLHHAVRDFQPDVIHSHVSFSDFPLLYHALELTVPLILTHHTHAVGMHLDLYRTVVFSTESLRAAACATDASLFDRSRLIRPAVERLFADPAVPVQGKRRGILFVGGLRLDKGLQNLLAAYAKSAALRKIPLRVCGIGPEEKTFRDYARRRRIPATFLGKVPPEDVRREMLAAELLVNPSPAEGFSLALAEAMCCGTPVIGWKPQVEETRSLLRMDCGIGCDPAEHGPQLLAEWILELRSRRTLVSPSGRKKLSAKARAFFSIERFTTEYMCLYDDLVAGHG
jgi:glycosyltransferase involved in cell wall biosynthesis